MSYGPEGSEVGLLRGYSNIGALWGSDDATRIAMGTETSVTGIKKNLNFEAKKSHSMYKTTWTNQPSSVRVLSIVRT